MVDPNVFEFVKDNGYDPKKFQDSPSAWVSTALRS